MGGGEVTVTATEKTPPQGNDGANEERFSTCNGTTRRPSPRYIDLNLIRCLAGVPCRAALALSQGEDLNALHSDACRLILHELLSCAAEHVQEGRGEHPVNPMELMDRVQTAGGGKVARDDLAEALVGECIDGMLAARPDVFAIPVMWKAVNEQRVLREAEILSNALHVACERRDIPALLWYLDGHAPRVIERAKRAGLLLDASRADGREVR